jgi:hypothetical protein
MNVLDKKQLRRCKDKKCDIPFHQPGEAAGYREFSDANPKTCPNLIARVIGDNPWIVMSDFTSKCPYNTSKIAIIIDESDDYDDPEMVDDWEKEEADRLINLVKGSVVKLP